MFELTDEDRKLVTLARGAMGRTGGADGAAVRDLDGRTYAAGPVDLQSLTLTALQACVAAAISSGAEGIEAAVLVGGSKADPGIVSVREMNSQATVFVANRGGDVEEVLDVGASQ